MVQLAYQMPPTTPLNCCAVRWFGCLWTKARTGTNVADISGNGHGDHLFGTPLPIWTKGVISNALAFDGVGNYVSVPDAPDLTPSNTLTLSAWVKASPTTTGIIVVKWMSDGQSGSYSLALTNGQIGVEISLDGVYYPSVATTGIEDTDWHHVAGILLMACE